ncbi:MAG: tRNA (N(6)-L-threonylcarbamoyladenosine(37)-C(2))-methylthiotransferase MtaB [Oscillospiraceae bacterium]|nr:tRNA (N(6)-L-threonylcarbamoyladenosine(37)-C(2))-methylthiotransferase MtaB [Oscillospiraceae bacterium]
MRFKIETLGCKVNQYESAAVATLLTERGHTHAADGELCDAVILNTCAVTGEAARKSRQAARRLLGDNPDAVLAVCGCASEIEPKWASECGAKLVYGAHDRLGFADALDKLMSGGETAREIADSGVFELLPAAVDSSRTRASLKIEDGCDNFCAYCVIPYARGRVRSMPLADIAAQAKQLAEQGYREIVVTGIEIASYGKDMERTTLLNALYEIEDAAPDVRIRLSSLEPTAINAVSTAYFGTMAHLAPHFHLSLQSGCDATLKRMRRKYDTERFLWSVQMLRNKFDNCGITADLIVGFPGETDEEFAQTLEFLRKCAFSAVHVFPYSKRAGTLAASMAGQLSNAVKSERAKLARDAAAETRAAFLNAQVGKTLTVLFETERDGTAHGHSGNYLEVTAHGASRGEMRRVVVERVEGDVLSGKIAE